MDINNFIIEYWKQIASQNEMELRNYFHEDACIRWHNTNEKFNVSEFLRANCDYPGNWSGEVERIEQRKYSDNSNPCMDKGNVFSCDFF